MHINKIRIQFNTVCEILDMSRDSVRNLIRKDPNFPTPIKQGESKQSPVYFDYQDLLNWHESKKNKKGKDF